jgi:hypothetical protein
LFFLLTDFYAASGNRQSFPLVPGVREYVLAGADSAEEGDRLFDGAVSKKKQLFKEM